MKAFIASVVASAVVLALPVAQAADNDLAALEKAARSEGQINSVGMPDSWANWKDTWNDISSWRNLMPRKRTPAPISAMSARHLAR